MSDYQLGTIEARFADLIWEKEPLTSAELVKHCEALLQWKKSTTYTVLKRLCEKGIFRNENGTISSLISRQDFYALQSERFVEERFQGSLPAFLAAFTSRKQLSPEEVSTLRRMIEDYEGG